MLVLNTPLFLTYINSTIFRKSKTSSLNKLKSVITLAIITSLSAIDKRLIIKVIGLLIALNEVKSIDRKVSYSVLYRYYTNTLLEKKY